MAIWTRFNIVTSQWIFRVPHLAIYRSSGSCDEQVLTITPSNVVNPMINLPFGGGYHPFMVILGMVGFTTLRTISPKKAGRGRSVKTPPHKLSDVRYPSQMLQICTNIYATIIKCIFSYFIYIYIWVNFGKHTRSLFLYASFEHFAMILHWPFTDMGLKHDHPTGLKLKHPTVMKPSCSPLGYQPGENIIHYNFSYSPVVLSVSQQLSGLWAWVSEVAKTSVFRPKNIIEICGYFGWKLSPTSILLIGDIPTNKPQPIPTTTPIYS